MHEPFFKNKNKEGTAEISGNIQKTSDSQTIGWKTINMAIWLILNASSKPTCLVSFKTKFYEEKVSKLN